MRERLTLRITLKPTPKGGDSRERKLFLWFPCRFKNVVYWLEMVTVVEEFTFRRDYLFDNWTWEITQVRTKGMTIEKEEE